MKHNEVFGWTLKVLSFLLVVIPANALDKHGWRKQSIYSLLTDRFASTNPKPCNPEDREYCGGNWRGIIDKLDYIQGMGFTAIWISPIIKNIEGRTKYGEAYHGYWPQDLYTLNPHFGTEQDLIDLADALHDRGMYLMVDTVVNHMGSSDPRNIDYGIYRPFNQSSHYHPMCPIEQDKPLSLEQCWIGTEDMTLPDIDTENPQIIETLYNFIHDQVKQFKIDGLRVDATKHVRRTFWPGFCESAGVYCQGEEWTGQADLFCEWQEYMDGLHNFPVQGVAAESVIPLNDRALRKTAIAMNLVAHHCKDSTLLGLFLESQDAPRLAALNNDYTVLKNAMTLNLMSDGIPIVFYGQEQMFNGSHDPVNRPALWDQGYNTDGPLYQYTSKVNKIRRDLINSEDGEIYIRSITHAIMIGDHVMVMYKGPVITFITNYGAVDKEYLIKMPGSETMIDLLTCTLIEVEGEVMRTSIKKGEPKILYPYQLAFRDGFCQEQITLQEIDDVFMGRNEINGPDRK
ncbi:alpha-amylase homolog Mde5 [Schizosaccharomyces pombe]|uniref:Putative cell wall assembly protein mde5 n=1 Tax=Schizosaccharomyces pombe (strain 972 / ATCC 24843) TaxID=284812 RepID=MDE5_SCHPO|nr:alpha-amylase [Schizosaccharomyces pombe]O14154.1 RecName: Full=Alpha-amylase mde5; AltName: Full=1,4-alpha-D-glucan glucanohydrolase; AltName: Full=Mei4-dependent protein 5; AltName: Full=Meiotic expression up-regulated protein 30; Flags: Precursor [Schizosaccharomyces pombe 972h-]CAD62442.2 alpha-amylase homolog Mde5 [Schizosaccharomyces pombe]|eukprot:NP_001343001.1 alpha-amylase [Schizosaccharomyces pombe]